MNSLEYLAGINRVLALVANIRSSAKEGTYLDSYERGFHRALDRVDKDIAKEKERISEKPS